MNFLLNADLNSMKLSDDPSGILGLGGQVVLIGMVTVFAVLILLWGCLTVFKIVFHDLPNKKANQVVAEKEVVEEYIAPVQASAGDDEIIAVIAAAIAAAEGESGGSAKFRVVSFRRR